MNLEFDPLWPWSVLGSYLSGSPAVAYAAVAAAGAAAFVVPLLAILRPFGWGPSRLLRATAGVLLLVVALLLFQATGTTGGVLMRLQGLGLTLLAVVPLALAGLTAWTYLSVPGASRRRVGAILALRLAAYLLVLLAITRPSLGFPDKSQMRSLLVIAADCSRSMTIQDEPGNQSRWDRLVQKLQESAPILRRLRDEQQTDVALMRFAGDVAELDLDNPGPADGKWTDTGNALHALYDRRQAGRPLRGLLLLSDGADNGTVPALPEAGRWRGLSCPLYGFGCGKPTTPDHQNDVALTSVVIEPAKVQVKGKMTVKVQVEALGFENTVVRAHLLLDDKEVLAQDVPLKEARNEVKLPCPAPEQAGDYRMRVVLDPPAGDLLQANNTIETFVTVYKGGISVLLVDKQRAWEPQAICDAVAGEERIHLYPVWLRGGQAVDPAAGDLFQFDRQHYDVIIIGDVTAAQMTAVNPRALEEIQQRVRDGAGFLMLGGYYTFDNGDWKGTPIEPLLPVKLDGGLGQVTEPVPITPTHAGLERFGYLLRLDGKDPKEAWASLEPLEGMTHLGEPTNLGTILATGPGNLPVLVTANYGDKGRTLAFAGDTTHRWIRDARTKDIHTRFWRHLVVWLAHQEDAGGHLWVQPDTRRLPVRSELGFSVGARGKGGKDLPGGDFKVKVLGPDGKPVPDAALSVATGPSGTRGVFKDVPGVYRMEAGVYSIEVTGEAKDPATGEVVRGDGPATSRFIVYDEDVEMMRRAADHEFLKKLFGEGNFRRVEDLPAVLAQLETNPLDRTRPKMRHLPDWRQNKADPRSPSPFLLGLFALFVALLAGEWLLRRSWGLA
jgi:uncharacterized membrane protein